MSPLSVAASIAAAVSRRVAVGEMHRAAGRPIIAAACCIACNAAAPLKSTLSSCSVTERLRALGASGKVGDETSDTLGDTSGDWLAEPPEDEPSKGVTVPSSPSMVCSIAIRCCRICSGEACMNDTLLSELSEDRRLPVSDAREVRRDPAAGYSTVSAVSHAAGLCARSGCGSVAGVLAGLGVRHQAGS
jgi:hypothetical protein